MGGGEVRGEMVGGVNWERDGRLRGFRWGGRGSRPWNGQYERSLLMSDVLIWIVSW